jgi:hypothetical protein
MLLLTVSSKSSVEVGLAGTRISIWPVSAGILVGAQPSTSTDPRTCRGEDVWLGHGGDIFVAGNAQTAICTGVSAGH